jgi:DNA-binding transcriptional MerR regulator
VATPSANQGPERSWTVRQLADEFGVTTRTLRFYESEGLIAPAREGANRRYSQRDRARLRLILRGRRFGMSLNECRELIDMYDGAELSERKQLQALLGRLGEIAADLRERQSELQRTLTEVQNVAAQCRARLDAIKD